MRALITTTVLGLALAAPPVGALADDAKPRGGGSAPSSAAGRHPSSSGHVGGQPGGHGGGYSAPGGSYSASAGRGRSGGGGGGYAQTGAQARHPRPGTGHGYRYPGGYYGHGYGYGGYGYYPYYGSYYWPYWGWGFYGGWGYPYGWGASVGWGYPSGGWGYPYGGYGGYGYSTYDAEIGSLRLIVEPNKAKVYVDGSYAGKVDDFDGVFQSLKLPRGRHDIAIKLDGYQTHRLRVFVTPSHTMKIRFEMAKGGGETFEDLTRDLEDVAEAQPPRESQPGEVERRVLETGEGERREPVRVEPTGPGILRLDVRPVDATVYVDGEFRGAAGALERVTLAPGRHLLEVVRPGFRTVQREIEIRPGKTEEIAVDLERS